MSDVLFLDIETIPSQLDWVKKDLEDYSNKKKEALSAPKSYKKEEVIKEWFDEKHKDIDLEVIEKYEKLSFDGAANHIVSIGCAINDADPVNFTVSGHDIENQEPKIIKGFFDYLREQPKGEFCHYIFVGHNITGFDIKVIRQRSIILGIKQPLNMKGVYDAKPWDKNPYDTMVQWDGRNFISLDKLAKAFGLQGKSDVNGSMVYKMYQDGEFDAIGNYCCADVDVVRNVYHRMVGKEITS